jgi:hypothetical protein
MKPIQAWHFIRDDSTILTDSMKRPLKVHQGQTLRHRGPLKLCKKGLHASVRPLDALEYAPGSVACRVECSGGVIHGDGKLVCSRRKVLWMVDASRVLHEFAIWCAEEALGKVRNPDPRSLKAVEVKKLWLNGKATDEELKAAWEAAWNAASEVARQPPENAAWNATKEAARYAARNAAWDDARYAARNAAWDAARHVIWGAARNAATRESQNEELERSLLALQPH